MKVLPLTQGKVAFIDWEDENKIAPFSWSAHRNEGNWYAKAKIPTSRGVRLISLHRFLLDFPAEDIDHKNGNGLDCRRSNLRLATPSQNGANQRKTISRTSSPYKGVSWVSRWGRWRAYISPNRRQTHLGYFQIEKDAALAYDRAAKIHFGTFALLNFP